MPSIEEATGRATGRARICRGISGFQGVVGGGPQPSRPRLPRRLARWMSAGYQCPRVSAPECSFRRNLELIS